MVRRCITYLLLALLLTGCARDRKIPQANGNSILDADAPGSGARDTPPAPQDAPGPGRPDMRRVDPDIPEDAACAEIEICDGIDNDCDSIVDEALSLRCTTSCGEGTSTCQDGRWSECVGPASSEEVCDGVDNNCDGTVDEGLTRPCNTPCGEGTERCLSGRWRECDAPAAEPETCDGFDNDCNGTSDDDLTRPCETDCGSGAQTCEAGRWLVCDAPQPQQEVCDEVDNDCDGTTDQGVPHGVYSVSQAALEAEHPTCNADLPFSYCMSAAHRWCKTQGRECYRSGVGMLSVQGDQREVLCLSSEVTIVRGTHEELTAASGLNTNVQSLATPLGLLIADLFCQSRGHAAGFGPVEYNTEIAFVVCVDGDDLERIPISNDDYVDAGCNIFSQSDSIHCTGLSHQRCVANGYRAGFGPIGDAQQLFTLCFP